MAKAIKYPIYMNHQEHPEPQRVDNKAEQTMWENRGWTTRRIWKEFPKMVNGIIIGSKEEETLLLDAEKSKPKVVADTNILDADGQIISTTAKPLVINPPIKGSVQVTEDLKSSNGFEILSPAGHVIETLHYDTWKEAQQKQKELNENVPGHKARKIEQ